MFFEISFVQTSSINLIKKKENFQKSYFVTWYFKSQAFFLKKIQSIKMLQNRNLYT